MEQQPKITHFKSSTSSLLIRGSFNSTIGAVFGLFSIVSAVTGEKDDLDGPRTKVKFWDLFRPWKLVIDEEDRSIIVRKRNWYLIGHDESAFMFNSIRHVHVKNLVFGADITIKVPGTGQTRLMSFSKKDAKLVRQFLLNKEWVRNDTDVIAVDDDY